MIFLRRRRPYLSLRDEARSDDGKTDNEVWLIYVADLFSF